MTTIHLHNLKFFSYHGIHAEEKVLGNDYEVNVDVVLHQVEKIESIHQTINYESIYDAVKRRMAVPTHLLETLARLIAEEIILIDPIIKSINVHVKKLFPPIESFEGSVGVSYKKEF